MENNEENESSLIEDDKSSAPSYTIESCLSMIKSIVSQRGEAPFSKKDASLLLGKSPGNISIKLGASGQYGLLSNERGKGYRVTTLYNKIEMPSSVEGKTAAMLSVMNNPPVYRKLIEDYNGKVLPANEEMFVNLLVTDYSMIKASAIIAVKVFIKNARLLGIIDNNNRLRYIIPITNNGDQSSTEHSSASSQENNQTSSELKAKDTAVPDNKMFEQPIDLGIKTAYLRYPRDITADEISILKIMLDASLSALVARQKIVENKNPA